MVVVNTDLNSENFFSEYGKINFLELGFHQKNSQQKTKSLNSTHPNIADPLDNQPGPQICIYH